MQWKHAMAVLLTVGFVTSAFAAGSPSPSRRPAPQDTYDLAVKAVKAKNYERAIGLLRKVVRREPDNADAWNWLGFSYRSVARFDEALAAYDKALAIDPDHRGANEYLGELYLKTGKLEKAKEQLRTLDRICAYGCKELDDLKAAIKAYESGRRSG